MAHFPGIAMIIDDQIPLIYSDKPENREQQVQWNALTQLRSFLDNNFIPFVSISDTQDIVSLKTKIKGYDNVRLIILDLDLNDDGEVGDEDDVRLIEVILKSAIEKYGYFYLLINSAHSERWADIKVALKDENAVFNKPKSSVQAYDKSEANFEEVLMNLQVNNFSLELVYDFECALNIARDKAFSGLIDYDKRTWNKILQQLISETSTQANFLLSSTYLTILRQHLLSASYPAPVHTDPIDESHAIGAHNLINYIDNIGELLANQPIWTGNLYRLNSSMNGMDYAMIITPECDLAQKKFITYLIVLAYEVNSHTLPDDYIPANFEQTDPPLHAMKAGKRNGKWREKANLKDKNGLIDHLYQLPFASENVKTIILDFRDITFIKAETISKWKLLKRVNEPMLTDIMDKISTIFNRKGLLPVLPNNVKVFP